MEVIERDFEQATAQHISLGSKKKRGFRSLSLRAIKVNADDGTPIVLPGVLLAATNSDGSLDYFKSIGHLSVGDGSQPISSDTTVVLASATKIVTCVAVMQCVERGLIHLDSDITENLPEWANAVVLTGFDQENGGKPILAKPINAITLRQLLSHTSGITGLESEQIMQYYGAIGNSRGTLIPRYFMSNDPEVKTTALEEIREVMGSLVVEPLIFEPGTNWGYGMHSYFIDGQGVDWAGQIVERVTHMTLEEYCQKNIFNQLDMASTAFRLSNHPHVAANLMRMHSRGKDGKLEEVQSIYPSNPKMDLGGSNLYTSGPDFIKFLASLLRNDGKLLRPETADMMFNYRLPDTEEFAKFKTNEEDIKDSFGDMAPDGMRVDHCLAGQVVLDDLISGRKAGSVSWSGATRCFWWIDRTAEVCGFFGSQIMVMGEQQISAKYFRNFEKAIYEQYGNSTR